MSSPACVLRRRDVAVAVAVASGNVSVPHAAAVGPWGVSEAATLRAVCVAAARSFLGPTWWPASSGLMMKAALWDGYGKWLSLDAEKRLIGSCERATDLQAVLSFAETLGGAARSAAAMPLPHVSWGDELNAALVVRSVLTGMSPCGKKFVERWLLSFGGRRCRPDSVEHLVNALSHRNRLGTAAAKEVLLWVSSSSPLDSRDLRRTLHESLPLMAGISRELSRWGKGGRETARLCLQLIPDSGVRVQDLERGALEVLVRLARGSNPLPPVSREVLTAVRHWNVAQFFDSLVSMRSAHVESLDVSLIEREREERWRWWLSPPDIARAIGNECAILSAVSETGAVSLSPEAAGAVDAVARALTPRAFCEQVRVSRFLIQRLAVLCRSLPDVLPEDILRALTAFMVKWGRSTTFKWFEESLAKLIQAMLHFSIACLDGEGFHRTLGHARRLGIAGRTIQLCHLKLAMFAIGETGKSFFVDALCDEIERSNTCLAHALGDKDSCMDFSVRLLFDFLAKPGQFVSRVALLALRQENEALLGRNLVDEKMGVLEMILEEAAWSRRSTPEIEAFIAKGGLEELAGALADELTVRFGPCSKGSLVSLARVETVGRERALAFLSICSDLLRGLRKIKVCREGCFEPFEHYTKRILEPLCASLRRSVAALDCSEEELLSVALDADVMMTWAGVCSVSAWEVCKAILRGGRFARHEE